MLSRLGLSTARAFSVNTLAEVTRTAANNSLETALKLPVNTICNATMTNRAFDYYSFEGKKGRRVAVDCAATGIDSRLTPVVTVADANGRDLVVNRTGGVIDFTPPPGQKVDDRFGPATQLIVSATPPALLRDADFAVQVTAKAEFTECYITVAEALAD